MVDAQGAGGRGARRVAPGAREEASDLVIVEDAAIAVVGDSYFVGRFHVAGRGVVAADPGGQPRPRGRRGNGTPYERHDYLPVTALEMGLSRQNDAWSDAQVARNVKDAVLRQLGQPGPDEPIYMISGEVYFLPCTRPTSGLTAPRACRSSTIGSTPRSACANRLAGA